MSVTVKFVPTDTRTITDVPAKIVVELTVEQAARYRALLGKLTHSVDYELYEELGKAVPKEAQLIFTGVAVITPEDFSARC